MDKLLEIAPFALELLGMALLWMLKATWFVTAVMVFLAWGVLKIILSGFFFGRLPRSYIRAFD